MDQKILESRANDLGKFENKYHWYFKFEVKILERSFKYVGQLKKIS